VVFIPDTVADAIALRNANARTNEAYADLSDAQAHIVHLISKSVMC